MPLLFYLAAVNLIAFVAYAWDKQRAVARKRRVPERTLLFLAAIGGSPGAFAAQRICRHKISKRPFQAVFRMIVVVQAAALVWAVVGNGIVPLP
ncbi:DUF1294 domain-containing protein [Caulobacter sp. 17J80-11]|uniref:DUF1294 domain-containing protein n=1 Tax=Caulobacter sp. 17J80-11 TaxID=2763502 RepID=UPI0016534C5A|nr:DUF1294 domain-containing protein [Caulobacter sp. 17J80-11]MBC6980406.1 DUF1294 domain-containing protein [Caulobacter sp. 17J80-11]